MLTSLYIHDMNWSIIVNSLYKLPLLILFMSGFFGLFTSLVFPLELELNAFESYQKTQEYKWANSGKRLSKEQDAKVQARQQQYRRERDWEISQTPTGEIVFPQTLKWVAINSVFGAVAGFIIGFFGLRFRYVFIASLLTFYFSVFLLESNGLVYCVFVVLFFGLKRENILKAIFARNS